MRKSGIEKVMMNLHLLVNYPNFISHLKLHSYENLFF